MIGARSRRRIASVGTLSIDLVYENLYVAPCLQWDYVYSTYVDEDERPAVDFFIIYSDYLHLMC
jgi:hypothetical protein